jgi:transcriptional regulator with XRE-family HTH domain
MGLKQTVAENVRRLRLERGYTQKSLSRRADINSNNVGMIEREECSPTLDMLEKIANALEVDPISLFEVDALLIAVNDTE